LTGVEFLLVVLVLVVLVALHRRNNQVEQRLRTLEERVQRLSLAPVLGPQPATPAPPVPELPKEAPAAPGPAMDAQPADRPQPDLVAPPPLPLPPQPPQLPRPPGGNLEEMIGSRWAVWVGGVALALGGIFLVRYSIEQGLIGPHVRVAMGLLFAFGLLALGEWLRRREEPLGIAAFGQANIPAVLTAAGTSTAFASVYAAYALYALIGPVTAFVALGAVAFATMAAAILHGPALGGLGLVASLASPLLVDTEDPSPFALVLYLAFAVGAAYGVARIRLWRWLAISAAAGALLWGVPFLLGGTAWQAGLVAHVLIQLALALLFLVADPYRDQPAEEAGIDPMVSIVLFLFAVLAVLAGVDLGAGLGRPAFIGTVAAMLAASAILYPPAAAALLSAGFAVVGTLAIWPVLREAAREPGRLIPDLPSTPYPDALATYIGSAVLLTALVAGCALLRLGFGLRLRFGPAAWYAAAATLTPLAALVVAYWRIASFDHSIPFAVVAAALALAFSAAAAWLRARDADLASPALRLAVGAVASAAVASLAAGLTFAFDRGVLTIALALSALGTAVIAERIRVPALRWMVGALGVAVAARLAWDPSVVRGEIGTTPIFNWLLWGYGVPAVAFLLAARVLSRGGRDWVVRFVESLGFVFAALLVFLEIRHALHAGDPFALRSSHLEAGLVVTEALAFTLLMVRLDLFRPDSLYRIASLLLGALALAGAALALGLRYNPFFSHEPIIGGAVFNSLLAAYLLPAAMAAAVAWAARENRPRAFVLAAAGLAVALLLAYCVLEIRRLFHPDGLVGFFRPTSQAELWCYSLALLANGLGLLALGIVRQWQVARMAALACLVAAVLKVFLVDLSALEGLTRALSFVGLGMALLLIGFVYQRLIARPGVGQG
jgi:uncharacterized membrane protein